MTKRRIVSGLIILAVVAAAAFIIIKALGPKTAEEESETVTTVGVHVGKIVKATLHRYVAAYGTVEPEPAGEGKPAAGAFISAPVGGILTGIEATEGRVVERGAVLFRLDSRIAEVAVARARKELELAERTFERQKKMLASEGTSQKSYQEAEGTLNAAGHALSAAQTELALLEIKAPLRGTLVRQNVRLGQSVEPNAVLAEVIAFDRLVVAAQVPSPEAVLLKPGQLVDFGSDGPAGGSLVFVGKDIDPKTDTVLVRAAVPAGAGFKPGRFLGFRIACEERRDCLAVPIESLVTEDGKDAIAIVEGDKAVKIPVKSGLRDGGLVEIEGQGLREGLTVVTAGAYGLPKESRIRVIGN